MKEWPNTAGVTAGYWLLAGTFNAMTGELQRRPLSWLLVGAVLTASAAMVDLWEHRKGTRRSSRQGE